MVTPSIAKGVIVFYEYSEFPVSLTGVLLTCYLILSGRVLLVSLYSRNCGVNLRDNSDGKLYDSCLFLTIRIVIGTSWVVSS